MRHRRLASAGAAVPAGARRRPRAAALVALSVLAPLALGGCSLPWRHSQAGTSVPVLDVQVGQCFTPPKDIVQQLANLQAVPCTTAHTLEAYASVDYRPPGAATPPADYPGDAALTTFADGTCAARYADYVGIDYRDSSFFYTYLLPSPRSWQDKDRSVVCFITTTGQPLAASLKGAKK